MEVRVWGSKPLLLREKLQVLSSLLIGLLYRGRVYSKTVSQPLLPAIIWVFPDILILRSHSFHVCGRRWVQDTLSSPSWRWTHSSHNKVEQEDCLETLSQHIGQLPAVFTLRQYYPSWLHLHEKMLKINLNWLVESILPRVMSKRIMILDDFERKEKILIDLLNLLIEGMHLNMYFKIHEQLIGRDIRICKFQIRWEETNKKNNNNKSILHHQKRETQVQ